MKFMDISGKISLVCSADPQHFTWSQLDQNIGRAQSTIRMSLYPMPKQATSKRYSSNMKEFELRDNEIQ